MREIILDTETTGISPKSGHRIVEIGCVEVVHAIPTGKTLHLYVDPERDVDPHAFKVHGLSREFLRTHKTFAYHVDDILDFLQNDPLVAHNASFDISFLNHELALCHKKPLCNPIVDTLQLAAKKFPGSPKSLDALCRRFNISLSERTLHGALLDANLLARIYLEFRGGCRPQLFSSKVQENSHAKNHAQHKLSAEKKQMVIHSLAVTKEEKTHHIAMLKALVNS